MYIITHIFQMTKSVDQQHIYIDIDLWKIDGTYIGNSMEHLLFHVIFCGRDRKILGNSTV